MTRFPDWNNDEWSWKRLRAAPFSFYVMVAFAMLGILVPIGWVLLLMVYG